MKFCRFINIEQNFNRNQNANFVSLALSNKAKISAALHWAHAATTGAHFLAIIARYTAASLATGSYPRFNRGDKIR